MVSFNKRNGSMIGPVLKAGDDHLIAIWIIYESTITLRIFCRQIAKLLQAHCNRRLPEIESLSLSYICKAQASACALAEQFQFGPKLYHCGFKLRPFFSPFATCFDASLVYSGKKKCPPH